MTDGVGAADDQWTLAPEEHALVMSKHGGTRLGFAIQFLVGRTARRRRAEIRVRFGFREATVADADTPIAWLRDHAAAEAGGEIEAMVERL
jgi:hypothetical protein